VTDAVAEAPEPTPAEPAVQESGHIEEQGEDAAAEPAEPDHEGILERLAEHIRTVAASEKQDVTELLAFLASHGL
jgi:hypothetical protein